MIKFTSKPFSFPGFPVLEQALNLFRIAVEGAIRELNGCPFIKGYHVTNVEIGTTWTRVYHKLGRTPEGWILTSIGARETIAERWQEGHLRTDLYVEFRASDVMTVSIWFF